MNRRWAKNPLMRFSFDSGSTLGFNALAKVLTVTPRTTTTAMTNLAMKLILAPCRGRYVCSFFSSSLRLCISQSFDSGFVRT